VLFFLIPVAWLAVLLFGVTMCRLAAHSDRSQAMALAEWVRTSYFARPGELPGRTPAEQVRFERLHGPHRATG